MLECPKCGHDNDLGRIFCAKCGEKLDISKVGAPSGVKRMARRGRKAVPFAQQVVSVVKKFIKVTLLSVAAAFITLVWLPPNFENKGFSKRNFEAFEAKRAQVEDAINNKQNAVLVFDEADLNAAMAHTVKRTIEAIGATSRPQLESIYISLGEGTVMLTVQQKWKSYRLAAQVLAKADNKDGKWQFRPVQVRVGRLPMPSWLPQQANDAMAKAFKGLWQDFEAERGWLEQFQSLEFKPGQLIISIKSES